jgi:hypothetical protein
MAAFEYRQAQEIRDIFQRHRVKYLFIGKSIDVEGFPVCNIDDIVVGKQAANRQKDNESLPRLLSFRDWLKRQR